MAKIRFLLIVMLAALLLSACAEKTPTIAPTPVKTATPTQPPATPTPTPEPFALRVNGVGVLLSDYEAELKRFQAAADELKETFTPEAARQRVLDALIAELLLGESAQTAGVIISDADVQARLDALTAEMGGPAALADWQAKNSYSEASFKAALRRAMLAAAGRDAIIAQVPETAEQVHARQILLLDETTANNLSAQLNAGADFFTQAYVYDPLAGGDLGWFPRNTLTQPDVEAAAFALQPGEISPVIKTSFGYHIVQVIEREMDHKLSADARRALQQQALTRWVEERRSQSTIEINLP